MGKNKYAHLAPKKKLYNSRDKTHRTLPVCGEPNTVVPEGTRIMFHGRVYATKKAVTIPKSGAFTSSGTPRIYVECKLQKYYDK